MFLPYRNGDDGLTDDADMPRRNCQNFAPFLPSEITKFFQQVTAYRILFSPNSQVTIASLLHKFVTSFIEEC
jgi:hypothetical protein